MNGTPPDFFENVASIAASIAANHATIARLTAENAELKLRKPIDIAETIHTLKCAYTDLISTEKSDSYKIEVAIQTIEVVLEDLGAVIA